MANIALAVAFVGLIGVLWKALDTVQHLSAIAASQTPVERAAALAAMLPAAERPERAEKPERLVLEGLSPRE